MTLENAPMHDPEFYLIIVDDDPDDLEMITDIYKDLNLQNRIIALRSGEELHNFLNTIDDPSDLPSLVVLDYNMPRLNGLELMNELKKDERFLQVPIAIYSTTITHDIEKELLLAGAIFCRQKGTNQESVRQLLIEFLSIADIYHESNLIYKGK